MIKNALLVTGVALLAYLAFWPVPIDPEPWQAPESNGYTDEFARNTRLEQFDAMTLAGLSGPEAVVTDANGSLYAGTHEGWIVRWPAGQTDAEPWVEVGGRPLGLAFDRLGNLWVANAEIGLQMITPSKQLSLEVSEFAGKALAFPDDLVVSSDSKVYFTDASSKFAARDWGGALPASRLELMEHQKSGRVIEFDITQKTSRLVMSHLSFANGVALDPLGRFLLVVETGEYRVWKHWLAGSRSGLSEVLIDNLPGFPDNIHLGQDGRYWVGPTAPRSSVLDALSDKTWLRKVTQRLPEFMQPKVKHYGMVLAINENGELLENLQAPSGAVYATTGAAETADHLYVTNLTAPFMARYLKSHLGLD